MEIGKKIKRARKARKLTQQKLAAISGVASGHIAQVETGRIRNPRIDVVVRLAKALDLGLSELVEKKGAA